MNIKVTKSNAFVIDPTKKYLMVVIENGKWNDDDKALMNKLIQEQFPNAVSVIFDKGTKFKLIEAPADEAK